MEFVTQWRGEARGEARGVLAESRQDSEGCNNGRMFQEKKHGQKRRPSIGEP